MLALKGAFLRSAFGRRMFLLFLLSATVPAVLMALLTYRGVTGALQRQAGAEMAGYSKAYALGLVARLHVAATLLRKSPGEAGALAERFGAVGDPEDRVFRSVRAQASGTGAVRGEFLAELVPAAAGGREATLALLVAPYLSAGGNGPLVGVVDPGYLFGDGAYLPANADICVFGAGATVIHCSNPSLEGPARAAAEAAAGGSGKSAVLPPAIDFGIWSFHGNDEFPRMPWTFVVMRPSREGLLADPTVGRGYFEVGLAVCLLVALLSLTQIRRGLGPLDSLIRGTRRLAAGNFESPIPVRSQDEFGRLAQSFNDMAAIIREREKQLLFEARHDSLTGLPNRLRVGEIIDARVAAGQSDAAPFAVLFVDLDRFKNVNDGLGHEAGDRLLAEAGGRIRGCLGESEVVARWGGDEFIVLSAPGASRAQVQALAQRVIDAMARAFCVSAVDAYVGASIGIACFPADGATRDALLRNADTAMYQAKGSGRSCAAFYDAGMNRSAVDLLVLEADLRRSIAAGEISVQYQPRLRLADETIVSAEALARWKHPLRGMVPPPHFVELAERIGVIDALGRSVLGQACAQLGEWKRKGVGVGHVSVNVSAHEFRNPRLREDLRAVVAAAGLEPSDIELEITESAFIHDVASAHRTLGAFRDAGFRIALDDFGTGFSSMAHLQTLPLDCLKIDRSFVMHLETKPDSRAIALAIVTMGHALGVRVVAEGVETPEQARILREWGCDEAQGYLYSRPLLAGEFEQFCCARKPVVAT
jgi:diguanylate cyclase (GGDEF)-like protein